MLKIFAHFKLCEIVWGGPIGQSGVSFINDDFWADFYSWLIEHRRSVIFQNNLLMARNMIFIYVLVNIDTLVSSQVTISFTISYPGHDLVFVWRTVCNSSSLWYSSVPYCSFSPSSRNVIMTINNRPLIHSFRPLQLLPPEDAMVT